jgi:glycerol kinase
VKNMRNYIVAVDQSTSATKAMLFDGSGKLICRTNAAHRQYYPAPGWVEHDALEIYANTVKSVRDLLRASGIDPREIRALSLTNQRETALIWDKNTGEPVYRAAVWQCQRAREICGELMAKGYAGTVHERTGLVLSPYFSAAKLKWILDNVGGVRARARRGDLLLGTVDSWLVWKLTKGRVHATDYTNACRTQLFNIKELKWDEELLRIFDIPESMLPLVKSPDEIFAHTDMEGILPEPVLVCGVMGDSNAALFGQACFEKGDAKITYGTGSSVMLNIGDEPVLSENGLLTSVAWGIGGRVSYVLDGNITCTGGTAKWLMDGIGLVRDYAELEKQAALAEDNGGVYIVPAFSGLGAPYWESDAKAVICGLTFGAGKPHIARAALESIAYQVRDVVDVMLREAGTGLNRLQADGGPAGNGFLMQFQADILGATVLKNRMEELSAAGSAYMAGLAVGIWRDLGELKKMASMEKAYACRMPDPERDGLYKGWKDAVKRTLYRPA